MNLTIIWFLLLSAYSGTVENNIEKKVKSHYPADSIKITLVSNGKELTGFEGVPPASIQLKITPEGSYLPQWSVSLIRSDKSLLTYAGSGPNVDLTKIRAQVKPGDKILIEVKKIMQKKGNIVGEIKNLGKISFSLSVKGGTLPAAVTVKPLEITLLLDGTAVDDKAGISLADLKKAKQIGISTNPGKENVSWEISVIEANRPILGPILITGNSTDLEKIADLKKQTKPDHKIIIRTTNQGKANGALSLMVVE